MSDDLISREEAMNGLIKCNLLGRKSCEQVAEMIKKLPAAYNSDKVIKQSAIKPVKNRCAEHTQYKCKCGYLFSIKYADGLKVGYLCNYCPDCGQAIDWSEEEQ